MYDNILLSRDKSQCDLLIVIGSSLKVRPVALIPSSLPPEVPQILINRFVASFKCMEEAYSYFQGDFTPPHV